MTQTTLIGTTRCCPTCGDPATVLDIELVNTPEGVGFIWWHCGCCQGWHIDVSALSRTTGHKQPQPVLAAEPDH